MGAEEHPFLLPAGPIDPEDGGDMFLQNVGSYTDYTALYI
jgi:hypothetical protein